MTSERVQRALAGKERQLVQQLQECRVSLQRAHAQVERCTARAVSGEQRFAALCAEFSRGERALPPVVQRDYMASVAREAGAQLRGVSTARQELLGASHEVHVATRSCVELSTRRELVMEHQALLRSRELLARELQVDESTQELAVLTTIGEPQLRTLSPSTASNERSGRETSLECGVPSIASHVVAGVGVPSPSAVGVPPGAARTTFRHLLRSHEARVVACESRERVGEAAVQMTMETAGGGRVALELSQASGAALRVSVRAESELDRRLLLRERDHIRSALRERGVQVGEIRVTLNEGL